MCNYDELIARRAVLKTVKEGVEQLVVTESESGRQAKADEISKSLGYIEKAIELKLGAIHSHDGDVGAQTT